MPVEVDRVPLTETLIERRILCAAECEDRAPVRRAIDVAQQHFRLNSRLPSQS